jgi:hypothetical protein
MGRSMIGPLRTESGNLRQADRERIYKVASLTGQIGAARKRGNDERVASLTSQRDAEVSKLKKRVSGTSYGSALTAALSPTRSGGIRRELGEIRRRAKANPDVYGKLVPGGNAASNRARGITN